MKKDTLKPTPPPSLLPSLFFTAVAVFFLFHTVGYALGGQPQARHALEPMAAVLQPLLKMEAPQLMLLIFINNAAKAGAAILLGVVWGIVPVIFLMSNGLVSGLVFHQAAAQRGLGYALAGLLPHGIIELPALFLAAALGLELAVEVMRWLRHRPSRVRHRLGRALSLYFNWIVPALVVAAAVEVFITPVLLRRF